MSGCVPFAEHDPRGTKTASDDTVACLRTASPKPHAGNLPGVCRLALSLDT